MKFVTFSTTAKSLRPGLLLEDGIQSLPYASLMELIEAGDEGLARVRRLKDKGRIPLSEARLIVYPGGYPGCGLCCDEAGNYGNGSGIE